MNVYQVENFISFAKFMLQIIVKFIDRCIIDTTEVTFPVNYLKVTYRFILRVSL